MYRHIENGKLTSIINENNVKAVDTAELIRVYGELKKPNSEIENSQINQMPLNENENSNILYEKIKNLETIVKMKDEIIESKEELIENKNIIIAKLEQINLFLEGPKENKVLVPKKNGFFTRLFSKGKKTP